MVVKVSSEAKRARSEYMKKWRAEHPEKCKEYSAKYWERQAEKNRKGEKGVG